MTARSHQILRDACLHIDVRAVAQTARAISSTLAQIADEPAVEQASATAIVAGLGLARRLAENPEVIEAFKAGLLQAADQAVDLCGDDAVGEAMGRVGLKLVRTVAHAVRQNEALIRELTLLREEVIVAEAEHEP